MRNVLQLNLLALLACALAAPAMAGPAAEIREVHVASKGDKETIDVHLTSSVVPAVIIATHPDRLVLQFSNTATPNRQQVALVDQNGVKAVRIGLNKADPPVTRVVVDLNRSHPYSVAMTGNTVRLTVMPASSSGGSAEVQNSDDDDNTLASLEAPANLGSAGCPGKENSH